MNVLVFKKKSHCDLDLGPRMLILKIVQDTVIINSCVQLNENRSINVRASDENVYFFIFFVLFSKNSLDFSPKELKLELVHDIIMPYICVNYNKNQSINEGTTGWSPASRAMTMFLFLKIATGTLTLVLGRSNLCKILSYYTVV